MIESADLEERKGTIKGKKVIRKDSMPNSIEELKAETSLTTTKLKEMFTYLFDLQESGEANMWGASAYLEREFNLGRPSASKTAVYWMRHYKEIKKAI